MENRVKQPCHDILFTLVIAMMHLNISSSSLGEETTLYITPSSSIQCHVKSCLTLSKLALNSSGWLSSNTTLFFLGGTHTLDTELFVSSINTFFMLTNSTREGTHVVVCQNRAGFTFDNAKELRIHGLKFIGCGSNKFSSIRNLTIENSTFLGQNNSETALDITKSNLTILNSTFIANRVGTCMKIFDVKTESNISTRIAGAILTSNSNVNITNCKFLNNSAEIGGAIYINSSSNISIINSTFLSNEATILNNTHIQDCWINNRESLCSGGVISAFKSRLIIDGCTFINNTNLCGGGGALSIQQKSVAEIHKSEFHSNRANGSGGALFIAILANVSIENSRFLMNSANSKGGVMFIALESEVTGKECVYERNSAKLSGGVTAMDQNSPFRDNSSKFYNNSAKTGGSLFVVRSGLTLNDSTFSNNQAKESGGVVHVLQSHHDSAVAFYGRCNLTDNSAGTGGAIYAVESTLCVVTGAVISIYLNTANDSGGSMYLYRSTLSHGYASVTNISDNKARNNGGGIHAINSMIVSTQSYRKGSKWPFQTLTFFTNNSASKGGGLYLESGAQLRLQKVKDNVYLRGDKLSTSIYFTSNAAQYGSAVYVADETYFGVCSGDPSSIYPYCPLDYCLPPNSDVHINLNILNGADAQCANNRSGLLCSLCQPGLSLSHGSSRCIPCSKAWYTVPVLMISSAVVGIITVVLLMALNLTVAVGTLNGLIFYANIIGINKSTFFSGLSLSTRYYSIFISWLNLEVGFDVCFFEGVDTYWKSSWYHYCSAVDGS